MRASIINGNINEMFLFTIIRYPQPYKQDAIATTFTRNANSTPYEINPRKYEKFDKIGMHNSVANKQHLKCAFNSLKMDSKTDSVPNFWNNKMEKMKFVNP